METLKIEVKNFAINCYGVFEKGEFITTCSSFDELIQKATIITGEKNNNTCSIATLKFTDTDEELIVEEGTVIMRFRNVDGTVYIANNLD